MAAVRSYEARSRSREVVQRVEVYSAPVGLVEAVRAAVTAAAGWAVVASGWVDWAEAVRVVDWAEAVKAVAAMVAARVVEAVVAREAVAMAAVAMADRGTSRPLCRSPGPG